MTKKIGVNIGGGNVKQELIKLGVNVGLPLLSKLVFEDLPKIIENVKADKEIKAQEKQDIINRYRGIINGLEARMQNDLSMTNEEYCDCIDKIEELEDKIQKVEENKTAKIIGVSALAVATGGLSLLALAFNKKPKDKSLTDKSTKK